MSTRHMVRYRPSPDAQQANRIDHASPHTTHSPGWPHISHEGNCLCLGPCCMGPAGCRCKEGCTHQSHPRETVASSAQ